MTKEESTALYMPASGLVSSLRTRLYSISINATTAGGTATLYNGRDATSGKIVAYVRGLANSTWQLFFVPPIAFEQGLYVDLDTNTHDVTVQYNAIGLS